MENYRHVIFRTESGLVYHDLEYLWDDDFEDWLPFCSL